MSMSMYYIDDRDLSVLLKELSEIKKEQLLRMKEIFETNSPLDKEPISVDQKRGQIALEVVNLILKRNHS